MMNLKIPNINEDINSIKGLTSIIRRAISSGGFCLDFRYCTWIQAVGVATLGALIKWSQENGFSADIKKPTAQYANDFLKNIDFYKLIHPEENRWREDENKIPLEQFRPQSDKKQVMRNAEKFRAKIESNINIAGDLLEKMEEQILEIYGNSREHSDSAIGLFTCGQVYQDKKVVELSFVDMGVGIAQKICDTFHGDFRDDSEALEKAFERGFSTKRRATPSIPRGLGLYLLQEFIKINGGKMIVIANKGLYMINEGREVSEQLGGEYEFPGTLIDIQINIDDTFYYLTPEKDRMF